MRLSESRFTGDMAFIKTSTFIERCKAFKKTHFTRSRKLPLDRLLLSVLIRKGRTLQMELRDFIKLTLLNEPISKVGYLKQRFKLNPLAFLALAKHHATNFYKNTSMVKKVHGYLILANDGSSLNVPTNEETLSCYGNASHKDKKPQAQMGTSCLYDTLNKMTIDFSVNRCNFSERDQALCHIDNMREVVGHHPSIVVYDRGYPSGPFLIALMERKQKFVIRILSTTFKKEQAGMKNDDCRIEVVFDKSRINPFRGTPVADKLVEVGSIWLRFVRLLLPNGRYICLVTNLTPEEFSTEAMRDLYRMRWEIETTFDDIKNKLCIENFTGTKPILLEQDIYATIYLCNVMYGVMLEAQMEMEREGRKKRKHNMSINKNMAIGILKEEIIHLAMEKDVQRRQLLMDAIVNEIKNHLLPIRKDRHYKRTKWTYAGKYANSRKRSY